MKKTISPLKALGFASIAVFSVIGIAQSATELARVNGSVITLEDFNKKYQENLKFFQYRAPTRTSVLEDLIKRELGIQEAKKEGIDKDPEVVDRMNTVLYHAFLDKKLSKEFENIKVSDEEARSFYEKNPEVRTSQIFIGVPPNAKPEDVRRAKEKITEIEEQDLRDGKMSFAEVAQRYSEGPAAPMGGDIDYQSKDKLDPVYYETALKLHTPGRTSGIIRTQFGFHIIKLTAIRPWEDADKAQVKRMVFDEKRTAIFDHYMNQLKAQAKVSSHPELLRN
jgi:parvulin-like peptidyl-prolyl isomerase